MRINEEKWSKLYEKYMLVIGVAGQSLFYIQAFEIFYKKNAGNVSFAAFLFGFISVTSWLIYGLMLKDRPLIVANAIATVGALAVLGGIALYG